MRRKTKERQNICRQELQIYWESGIRLSRAAWPGGRVSSGGSRIGAGGLGIIGAANAPAEWVREQIRETKKCTDKPFGVNVMLMSPYADQVAQVIAEEGVAVVTTGAGNPENTWICGNPKASG